MVLSPIGFSRFSHETFRFLLLSNREFYLSKSKKRFQTWIWDPGENGSDYKEFWIRNRSWSDLTHSSFDEEEISRWPLDLPDRILVCIGSQAVFVDVLPVRPSRNTINGRVISRSGGSKRSPPSPDQIEKRSSVRDQRQNGFDHQQQHHQRVNRSESTAQAHPELDTNGERDKATQEWPRIYIALSRKEKEEEFLVMKGTKLPHRPRKRAKNIDKALQFCFPGMWLSDLIKIRYDVREKKNVKQEAPTILFQRRDKIHGYGEDDVCGQLWRR